MESRILQLISALRGSGVRVSVAESAEAFSAVDIVGIQDREQFRVALRATLIKKLSDLPQFDKLFPLFFASGQPPLMGGSPTEQLTPDEAQMLQEALRQLTDELRARLERFMNGAPLSSQELEALGEAAGLGAAANLLYQNWMEKRMLGTRAGPQVRQGLEELFLQLALLGMDAKSLEQLEELIQRNLRGMREQISQFAGQRLAENLSKNSPSESLDALMIQPFERLSDSEKKALQAEVKRIAAALRTRVALRQKRSKNGHLDAKATIRANLRFQGVPVLLRHRDRILKPKLVVICDVSTSMRFCSELMLSLLFALQAQIRKTHAFAFIDHLESISGDYDGSNVDHAVRAVLTRMPSGHYNTDLGWALKDFNNLYLDTLNGRTTLILVGDGRNNYNDPRLDLFSMMAARAARTIWLNPEPRELWYGDSDMPAYAPLCDDVLQVRNLRELTLAVDQLLAR